MQKTKRANPKENQPKKKAKKRQKNFEKGLLKSFFLVMFVGDDLNCSFFFYKPMKLSNKMNIKHNSTIENRTEKTGQKKHIVALSLGGGPVVFWL